MSIQIQLRRGTASQWTTANTLLAQGEVGLETDTNKFKFGDGVTTWNSLPYYANGSVTSVALSGGTTGLTVTGSPITTSGTITLAGTLDVDNGGTGQTSYTDGQLLIGNTTGNTLTKTTLTAGSGIAITNGNGSISIAATNSGTVTAVTGTSPVVSSGGATPAISLASGYGDTQNPYASKTANFILGAPDGVSGVPTFRAVVAADIPTLNQNTTGTASNVTGTVAVLNGGTGSTTTSGARTNLGLVIGTDVLSPSGSAASLTSFPTFNQNTTGSAATLTTGRTLAITGDLAYTSPSFDGSTNVTAAGTLATVNTNVGAFTNATLTVNGKGLITAASSGTAPVTSVTATSPVASTGGTTPVISMPAATTSVSGYLTSTDWTTFNNKGSGTITSVTGTAPVVSSGGTTPAISMAAATTSVSGYLTSADWTTFNGKGSGTVTSVAATVPSFLSVTGSPITTSGTLAISLASSPTNGQLLIGNGTGFSYATLTAGSNITITNSAGGITIASSGGGTSSPIPKLQSWSIGGF